jgi:tRNA(fMet)-specific endonuclease VapC
MLKYLLDTNIAIYAIKRRPPSALAAFNRHAGQMAISAITLAELVHGAERSSDPARNLAVVEDFRSRLALLDYGERAAYHYGSIRAALEKIGQPIGVNDLHLAAQARADGMVLVTNNLREFERVPGLLTENWV